MSIKKSCIVLLLCSIHNKIISCEKLKTISENDFYISNSDYMNPFPYNVEIKSSNVTYNWDKFSITVKSLNKNRKKECEDFIKNIPNVICEFKTNFFKNKYDYFEFLINKEFRNKCNYIINNLENGENMPKYFNDTLKTYNNPFDENPFIFSIDEDKFYWKNSEVLINSNDSYCKDKINNILIDFNDSFQYFNYLLSKFNKTQVIQSSKIYITKNNYNINIKDCYNPLIPKLTFFNPFDTMIIIKDYLRIYRWDDDTNKIEILSPNWVNDNLSKDHYSIFSQLFKKAYNNFCESKYTSFDYFKYFIKKELGENTLVYLFDIDDFGWKNICSPISNTQCIGTYNNQLGFVEVTKDNIINEYDWENDKDDF